MIFANHCAMFIGNANNGIKDIHARWYWQITELCQKNNRDPAEWKIGRHSFLAGGVGKPEITVGEHPLERFDHPAGRDILTMVDPEHLYLYHLAAKHLAGWANRPTGEDIYNMFVHEQ